MKRTDFSRASICSFIIIVLRFITKGPIWTSIRSSRKNIDCMCSSSRLQYQWWHTDPVFDDNYIQRRAFCLWSFRTHTLFGLTPASNQWDYKDKTWGWDTESGFAYPVSYWHSLLWCTNIYLLYFTFLLQIVYCSLSSLIQQWWTFLSLDFWQTINKLFVPVDVDTLKRRSHISHE